MDAVSPVHPNIHKVRPMFPLLHPSLDNVHCRFKLDHPHPVIFAKDADMVAGGRERGDRRGGERGAGEVRGGRCRSPLVPLRNRQLPASFWQEPNVPRGYPYPFLPPYALQVHPMAALWSEYNGSAALNSCLPQTSTSANTSSKTSGHAQSSKEFLERLQSAQARGYDLASSRFPITEFLFYNYGLKSYLEPFDPAAAPTGHFPPGCSLPGSAAGGGASGGSEAALKHGSVSGAGRGAGVSSGLTFPTVCPYLGYNCPNLHNTQTPHRFWDCVTGQSGCLSRSLAVSAGTPSAGVSTGVGVAGVGVAGVQPAGQVVWKSMSGRTVSSYPGRYHPFAD